MLLGILGGNAVELVPVRNIRDLTTVHLDTGSHDEVMTQLSSIEQWVIDAYTWFNQLHQTTVRRHVQKMACTCFQYLSDDRMSTGV